MRTIFSAGLLSLLLAACNSSDTSQSNSLLSQPPYAKLTDSLREHPSDAGLYFRRGALLYTNNQINAAEEDLRQAWRLDPQEDHALGVVKVLREKNPDSAILFLQEAAAKLPNSSPVHIELARGYQYKKQNDQALRICNDFLHQHPGQPDMLRLQSELLQDNGNDSQATAILEQAYARAPGDVDLVHKLAYSYAESNNPKVLKLADSLIRLDAEQRHPEPYYFKGVYYSNTGHPAEAIKQFDEAIRHDFKFLNAYINKGIVYYDQKKYDQALKTFSLTAQVFPRNSDPYHWLAKTQEAMGLTEEARHNYQLAEGLAKLEQ